MGLIGTILKYSNLITISKYLFDFDSYDMKMFEQRELCSLIIKVFKFRVNFAKNERERSKKMQQMILASCHNVLQIQTKIWIFFSEVNA